MRLHSNPWNRRRAARSAVAPALVLGLGFLSFACGSGSPTGPDAPGDHGASIEGTVEASGAGNMKVSVMGTSLGTRTDATGRFSLPQVPAGNPTLRFEGSGADAQLGLQVAPGQALQIRVRVSGSQATLLSASVSADPTPSPSPTPAPTATPSPTPSPSPGDEVEFRGTIESINGTDLTVSGRLVHTDGNTRIRLKGDTIPFSALAVGQTVEVEGLGQSDGSALARKISVEDEGDDDGGNDDDPGDEVGFQGTIQDISGSDLTVSERLVHTDAGTRIRRKGDTVPFSALTVGQRVEVEGTGQTDGSVLAKKISIKD